jgi:flagellar assembly factor FliW
MSEPIPVVEEASLTELESKAFTFPKGLPGFPACKRFVLNQVPGEEPFHWLVSLDDPDLSFVVIEAFRCCPDFVLEVPDEELTIIGSPSPSDCAVLFIVRLVPVPEKGPDIFANTGAPIIINTQERLCRQILLARSADEPLEIQLNA